MIWIYNIVVNLYSFGIWIASFFNKKAKLWVDGRRGIFEQLEMRFAGAKALRRVRGEGLGVGIEGSEVKSEELGERSQGRGVRDEGSEVRSQESGVSDEEPSKTTTNHKLLNYNPKTIWIHVASLGEFEQGRPIIEKLKADFPTYKILLTFFSPSGYEIRKNYELADHVFYLPADTKKNAKRFIEIVNPALVIFVKYEFWLHYLNTLQTKKIPTLLVSAIFRPNQLFFKSHGGLFKKVLAGFDQIFVQNEVSFQLLKKYNYNRIELAGDTRVDRVAAIAAQAKRYAIIEKFADKNKVLVCGSTWPPDEAILIDFIKKSSDWKFIIAPHEIKESNIKRLQKMLPKKTIRYSEADVDSVLKNSILIIDNIGMLSSIYRFGKVAYIGGGFGNGIHNTLEPIAFGLPVIFGPKFKKFNEASTLVGKGGSFTIANSTEFLNIMNQLEKEDFYTKASQEAQNYILQNRGATEKILNYISKIL